MLQSGTNDLGRDCEKPVDGQGGQPPLIQSTEEVAMTSCGEKPVEMEGQGEEPNKGKPPLEQPTEELVAVPVRKPLSNAACKQ